MKAIYPGRFDPITLGHVDLIQRASVYFDELLVAVTNNTAKPALFDLSQRVQFIETATASFSCGVTSFDGLLVDYMRSQNIQTMIRGIRTAADYEYELQFYHANKLLYPELEVVFFPASSQFQFVSATLVREIITHNGDASQFVPKCVQGKNFS